MNYEESMNKLELIEEVIKVSDGSMTRIKAIEFNLYRMDRRTGASNFVFS